LLQASWECTVLIVCWSVKGGSGTTVVAAALTLMLARTHPQGALGVDLGGDLSTALGVPATAGPGLVDWLQADDSVGEDALLCLSTCAGDGVELIGPGTDRDREPPTAGPGLARWERAAAALAGVTRPVVVDATDAPPRPLLERATASLLVLRSCYLALRRATSLPGPVSGIVLVAEPGRALGRREIESAVGVPVVAEVPVEPGIARAVDAGLLSCRMPMVLGRALRSVA
jgi:hypothetical protein